MTAADVQGDGKVQYPTIRFHGAAGTVTGSCFAVETEAALVIIDCGLFQGSKTEKELNYRAFPFEIGQIDAVIVTHAHIDHTGVLPKLTKQGYEGKIRDASHGGPLQRHAPGLGAYPGSGG